MGITVLVIDDEANARENIRDFLTPMGYEVIGASTLTEAREYLKQGVGDVIILDVMLGDGYGPDLLYETASLPARPPIILITAFPSIEMAVDAMKSGAHDFLSKPFDLVQLEKSIQRAFEIVTMRRELALYRQSQQNTAGFIIGSTPAMKTLMDHASRAAQTSASVLITGETGTGKEVLAKYVHKNGPRSDKPYIAVNCGAIQSTMM
jgi:DNA-binding NtrC family response regulator